MEKQKNAYFVKKANKQQSDIVFEKFYKNTGQLNLSVVFVALDINDNIIGYLVAEEKAVPSPLHGTDWFIWNIYTHPEFRRQGIASAILNEAIKHAEQSNIRHIQGSVNRTLEAHMFWFKHNFCFQKYGQKSDDANNPVQYGNYSHMAFYRVDKNQKDKLTVPSNYRIKKANEEQLSLFFEEYILKNSIPLFKDRKDEILGFVAVDENEQIIGFITACPDELGAPLNNTQWLVPYIFVNDGFRRKGIGSLLINELIKTAKEASAVQLGLIRLDDEAIRFLHHINFDICYWYIMGGDLKPVSAAIRL